MNGGKGIVVSGDRLSFERRRFLQLSGGGVLAGALTLAASRPVMASPRFSSYPFTLGVASGDPVPDGVVLWTRLAPEPLAADGRGGMPEAMVPVNWQVAEDERFEVVVRAGAELASPDLGHSVHVDVRGLEPDRWYFYRFRVGSEVSPVGRSRTTPLPQSRPTSMSFAFASCQSYTAGHYTAHRHLAAENLDAVVFLGDYIYEHARAAEMPGREHAPTWVTKTLSDYRIRHALYKSDADLQAAHAAFPWIVTMDDHEVHNNYWGLNQDPDEVARKVAAYQAFYEHMPLRPSSRPTAGGVQVFRRVSFGDLATFHVIDTRQYRNGPPAVCGLSEVSPEGYCPSNVDPNRTTLGDPQAGWLQDGLTASSARWDILANQMFFTQRDNNPDPQRRGFNRDGWDGYVADRQALLDHVKQLGKGNFVVITGDSHQNWVLNTPPTYRDWSADVAPVATEFMVTSVTSGRERPFVQAFRPDGHQTPHLLYRDSSHGYGRVDVTRDELRTTYRGVSTVAAPTASVRDVTSWLVQHGRPGANLL